MKKQNKKRCETEGEKMNKEEKLIREYFEFDDINQSDSIEVLPLTIMDMLLEYEEQVKELNKIG
jgi:hypothetical protein